MKTLDSLDILRNPGDHDSATTTTGFPMTSAPLHLPPETFIYIHIPKTGGTALRQSLDQHFRLLFDYHRVHFASPIIKETLNRGNLNAFLDHVHREAIEGICGHLSLRKYVPILHPQTSIFTLIRDPIQRVISAYKHRVRSQDYPHSLEWAIENEFWASNLQSYQLQGMALERYTLIGLLERYSESLFLLNQLMGWRIPFRQGRNIAPERRKKGLHHRYDIKEELLERIREKNADDLALYQRAEQLFEEKLAALPPDILDSAKYFDLSPAPPAAATQPMKILIFGLAKTGTTALTYAIKKQIPHCSLVFEPPTLQQVDMSGDSLLVKALLVHQWQQEKNYFSAFDKKILIIRHPFDQLISLLLYAPFQGMGFSNDRNLERYVQLLEQKTRAPDSVAIGEILEMFEVISQHPMSKACLNNYRSLCRLLQETEQNQQDFYILRYEDFVAGNFDGINAYLGITLDQNFQVGSNYRRVARTRNANNWHHWFTEADRQHFAQMFNVVLTRLGYTADFPPETYEKEILPQHAHEYVIRVVNEARKKQSLPPYEMGKITIEMEGELLDRIPRREQLEKKNFLLKDAANYIELLQESIAQNPNFYAAYLRLGDIYYKQENWEEAKRAYRHLWDQTDCPTEIYNRLGLMYHHDQEITEAILCFQKALAQEPNNGSANTHLGNIFYSQNRWEQALTCYQLAFNERDLPENSPMAKRIRICQQKVQALTKE